MLEGSKTSMRETEIKVITYLSKYIKNAKENLQDLQILFTFFVFSNR